MSCLKYVTTKFCLLELLKLHLLIYLKLHCLLKVSQRDNWGTNPNKTIGVTLTPNKTRVIDSYSYQHHTFIVWF